jgi:hypothetical protein
MGDKVKEAEVKVVGREEAKEEANKVLLAEAPVMTPPRN